MRKLALVMVVMALALPAVADDAPDTPRAQEKVITFLDLDGEQVAQWDALVEDTQAVVAPLRDELDAVEAELRELLKGEGPDPTAVGVLVLQGKELKKAIGEAHFNYVKAFQAMLDGKQSVRFLSVRRAARLQPVLPAFGVYHLLPR